MALITEKPADLSPSDAAPRPGAATVTTTRLIELITDALHTADADGLIGIHIATSRAAFGEEAGLGDVLAATSTTGYVMGHSWIVCEGQIPASVWPVDAARNVLAIAKSLARKGSDDDYPRTVDISLTKAPAVDDGGEHPGWIVTVRDTPALFDSDTELQFHAEPETRFPIAAVSSILGGLADLDVRFKNVPLTVWGASVLKPLVAIAVRRKKPIQLYRYTGRGAHLVQIGDTWIGAAMARHPDPEQDVDGPTIEAVLAEPEPEAGDQ